MTKTRAKEAWGMFARGGPGSGHHLLAGCGLVVALLIGGCATQEPKSTAPEFGSGVTEYQQITDEAMASLGTTLDSLNKAVQSDPSPPDLIAAFSHQVQQLQIDSLRIRARAQAIQARGDAFFATWSESITAIKDPLVRELAERHRAELEQSFFRIKVDSQKAGAAYKPCLAGLRMLRVNWEKDPGQMRNDANSELLRSTREHGDEVIRELRSISDELKAITRMITPATAVAKS